MAPARFMNERHMMRKIYRMRQGLNANGQYPADLGRPVQCKIVLPKLIKRQKGKARQKMSLTGFSICSLDSLRTLMVCARAARGLRLRPALNERADAAGGR